MVAPIPMEGNGLTRKGDDKEALGGMGRHAFNHVYGVYLLCDPPRLYGIQHIADSSVLFYIAKLKASGEKGEKVASRQTYVFDAGNNSPILFLL